LGATKFGQHADETWLLRKQEVESGALDGLFTILEADDCTLEGLPSAEQSGLSHGPGEKSPHALLSQCISVIGRGLYAFTSRKKSDCFAWLQIGQRGSSP
jgi:hypothetical protein